MSNFSKKYHNPIDVLKSYWPDADLSHIEYDPSLRLEGIHSHGGVYRAQQSTHDGTSIFIHELIGQLLLPIVNMVTFIKSHPPKNWDKVTGIKYTVGPIRHSTVYGRVDLPVGKFHGQKDRVRMPVLCSYVEKEAS